MLEEHVSIHVHNRNVTELCGTQRSLADVGHHAFLNGGCGRRFTLVSPVRRKVQAMFSIGQLLKLKPGCEEEYKRRHDELWPEMAAAMRRAGVNMAIYLYDDLIFVFATAPDQHSWDELERDPVTPRWDKYMSDILVDDEQGQTFIKNLRQMFAFGEFAGR